MQQSAHGTVAEDDARLEGFEKVHRVAALPQGAEAAEENPRTCGFSKGNTPDRSHSWPVAAGVARRIGVPSIDAVGQAVREAIQDLASPKHSITASFRRTNR